MTNYFVNVQEGRGHESFDNNEKFGDEIVLLCHELPGTILNKEHF